MKELTGRMTDSNRELVPHSWNLVRERTLTTELCAEGWYSEHSGVSATFILQTRLSV